MLSIHSPSGLELCGEGLVQVLRKKHQFWTRNKHLVLPYLLVKLTGTVISLFHKTGAMCSQRL